MRLTRTLRRLGRCLEVLLLVLLLAAVALTLRLAAGPIRLDALTGRLTAWIDSAGPFDVTLARPALAWSPEHQTVLLRVEDLEVRTKDGSSSPPLRPWRCRLTCRRLLTHRRVSLRELDVQLPGLQLARQADQRLVLGFGGHLGALPLGEATGGGALERLAGGKEGARDPRLALLHRVRVTATSLEFVDEPSGRRIESGDADLRLTRAAEGWEMRLEVAAVGGTAGAVSASSPTRLPARPSSRCGCALDDVPLAAFARPSPNVPLAGATLPLSATVRLSLDPATMTPGPGSFRLHVPAGTLDLPGLFPEPLDVRGLTLAGSGDAGWHEVRLEEGELGVGDAQAHATGIARRGEAGRSLSLDVTGDGIDAAAVKRLWPLPLVPKTRQWAVEHIDGGTAPTAHVEVSQPPGQEAARARHPVRVRLPRRHVTLPAGVAGGARAEGYRAAGAGPLRPRPRQRPHRRRHQQPRHSHLHGAAQPRPGAAERRPRGDGQRRDRGPASRPPANSARRPARHHPEAGDGRQGAGQRELRPAAEARPQAGRGHQAGHRDPDRLRRAADPQGLRHRQRRRHGPAHRHGGRDRGPGRGRQGAGDARLARAPRRPRGAAADRADRHARPRADHRAGCLLARRRRGHPRRRRHRHRRRAQAAPLRRHGRPR